MRPRISLPTRATTRNSVHAPYVARFRNTWRIHWPMKSSTPTWKKATPLRWALIRKRKKSRSKSRKTKAASLRKNRNLPMSPTVNRTQELLNDSTCPYDTECGSVWARFFCSNLRNVGTQSSHFPCDPLPGAQPHQPTKRDVTHGEVYQVRDSCQLSTALVCT